MRLLVDASFPQRVTAPNTAGVHIERWSGIDISDASLVREASAQGYDAVVFLGLETLAEDHVRDEAFKRNISIIVTVTDDPITGAMHLACRLRLLARQLRPRDVWVLRSDGALNAP